MAILIIVLLYLPSAFENSRTRLLWHDELFTYWISQAPSLSVLWNDLRTLDLNPPLVYLLTRLSFRLFGVNTLATRLPEILGFLVTLLALFRFVRIRLGATFALFAAALLMQSEVAALSVDARPYTLMLACLGIALVGWQSAVSPVQPGKPWIRPSALALTFAGVAGMLLSHIFSVLAVAALLLAELYRERRQRRIDPPVLLALLLPLGIGASYVPMLRNHGAAIYPQAFQPDAAKIFFFYINSIDYELLAWGLTALAVIVFLGRSRLGPAAGEQAPSWFFTPSEWILILGLLLIPLVLMTELMATHGAFFDRYAAVETIAVAMLTAVVLAHWIPADGRPDPRVGLLASVLVLTFSGLWTVIPRQIAQHRFIPTIANSEPPLEPCEACGNTADLDPTLPLVVASGLTFVEMNHRETPATLSRIFYLTDPAASTEFAHANIFEHMSLVATRFHFAGHTDSYSAFITAHPHFFVFGTYDYPEDWLLRKLSADHADIRVLDRVDDSYVNREVYEVKIAPPKS